MMNSAKFIDRKNNKVNPFHHSVIFFLARKNKAMLVMALTFLNRLTINSLRKPLIKEIT